LKNNLYTQLVAQIGCEIERKCSLVVIVHNESTNSIVYRIIHTNN